MFYNRHWYRKSVEDIYVAASVSQLAFSLQQPACSWKAQTTKHGILILVFNIRLGFLFEMPTFILKLLIEVKADLN